MKMFEVLAVLASVLLSLNAIFQFRRTYIERKTLKDLSFVAYLSCLIAVFCLFVRFVETGEWALVVMEVVHAILDVITLYWIIQSSD